MKKNGTSAELKRLAAFLPPNLKVALNRRMDEGLRLRQAWISSIPEPLASHAHPVRYAAGILTVHANTPAWATRLRHQYSTYIAALKRNSALQDITDLRVRVVPVDGAEAPPVNRPRSRLSATAAHLIEETAETISDPQLRAALRRLAQHGGSASQKRGR